MRKGGLTTRYTSRCESPLGVILLAADETGLTGLWLQKQKSFALSLDKAYETRELPVPAEAKRWPDIYFSGREPDFCPPLHFTGSAFRNEVWKLPCGIPYGSTTTYGEPAAQPARKRSRSASAAGPQARPSHMSAQAVDGAVGKNRISILVPCRRVVGANGSLTGCAGGIEKKIRLLEPEGAMRNTFFVPKKSAGAYPERKRPPRGVYPRGGLFQTLQNSDLIQSTRL